MRNDGIVCDDESEKKTDKLSTYFLSVSTQRVRTPPFLIPNSSFLITTKTSLQFSLISGRIEHIPTDWSVTEFEY